MKYSVTPQPRSSEILHDRAVQFMKGAGLGFVGTTSMILARTGSYWTLETFKSLVSGALIGGVLSGTRPLASSLLKNGVGFDLKEGIEINIYAGIVTLAIWAQIMKNPPPPGPWEGRYGGILGLTIF